MGDIDGEVLSEPIKLGGGINDANNETCGANSENLGEDQIVEESKEATACENPQLNEKIEIAVVTCTKDECDADSSLEIFFDVNEVNENTKMELQIEINKTTEGTQDEAIMPPETTNSTLVEDEISPKLSEVLTNGNDSVIATELEGKPANDTETSFADDIVVLSDDETETVKQQQNEEQTEDKAEITTTNKEVENNNTVAAVPCEEENVDKISAVAEIMDESNNSDSSNLLEISTVQEEREKERLQEKCGEEDDDEEEEDVEEDEEEEAEKPNEIEIEVVESNLDNELNEDSSPPAKRKKMSNDDKLEETLPENTVSINDKLETVENEKNDKEDMVIDNNLKSADKPEKFIDIEMLDEEDPKTSKEKETIENGMDVVYLPPNFNAAKERVPLEFLRKFKKQFDTMTRTDLEEFVTQKILEAVIYKSEFAECNRLLKIQEQISEKHRNHINELTKQLKDLNMVHTKVLKDLDEHCAQIVMPVKITRAVGLQVSYSKRADIVAAKNQQPNNDEQKNAQQRSSNTQKSNKTQIEILNRTAPAASTFFDASKPSTSTAAKEANLQIRKMNTNTSTNEDSDIGKVLLNAIKKPIASNGTKEVLPTTCIPASAYKMENYMTSLNQLSSGAITITPAKPKEKECIDLTEDDDCIVLPPITSTPTTTTTTTTLSSHILTTSQVYRQRNMQQTTTTTTTINKNNNRNFRLPFTQTSTNTSTSTVMRKMQPKLQAINSNSFMNSGSRALNNNNNSSAPPLVMIPKTTNTNSVATNIKRKTKQVHPAPLPYVPPVMSKPEWKRPPPRPCIRIDSAEKGGIVISWTMDEYGEQFAECSAYQIYAYQQTSSLPHSDFWRYVGDVKAMLLPMAVTLTQFQEGQRYFFAVRAVDVHKRFGPFSIPKTWT